MDISNYLSRNYNINELKKEFNETGKIVIENFLKDKFADYVLKTIKKLPGNSWFNCCGFGNTKIEKRIIPSNRKKQEINFLFSKDTSEQLKKILRKVVTSKNGTASLADINGYYVGGKTGTAESYGDKKNRINTFISIFPSNNPKYTLFVMLENPKINKDLIYD